MAGDGLTDSGEQYSSLVGFVYVFNLIVGTGALTMPAAFKEAGWLLSLIGIILLAFMSYLTLTFMTESMAISNARLRFLRAVNDIDNENTDNENTDNENKPEILEGSVNNERTPLLSDIQSKESSSLPSFEITERVEMGAMAKLYFNKVGMTMFHLCIIIYLYGDLSIYAAAVPKSLRDAACSYQGNDSSLDNVTLGDSDPCWSTEININRMDAYRIFVAAFLCFLGPFVFFNVQKTKNLQILTSLARWISFTLMLILVSLWLGQGKGQGHPVAADIKGIPNLFGVCVYSFMCHHSLPSLLTPIRNKSKLLRQLAGNYVLILIFYALLSFTAVFALNNIEDLYTLNFKPHGSDSLTHIVPFQYFLVLFPVFTLSTNFPIIAITLRNNLIAMFTPKSGSPKPILVKIICPLLALLPPIAVAIATNKVEFLVGITGSYAGAGIQYLIPAALVFYARKDFLAEGKTYRHQSPFFHTLWVVLAVGWTLVCVIFVTVNHIITGS